MRVDMEKNEILQKIIDYYTNGNKRQFAKMLGVSPQVVSGWFSRNSFDKILVSKKCLHINTQFILTGEGEMLKEEYRDGQTPPPATDTESMGISDYKHILNEQLAIITTLVKQLSTAHADLNKAMSVIDRLASNRHTGGHYMAAEDLHHGKEEDDFSDSEEF